MREKVGDPLVASAVVLAQLVAPLKQGGENDNSTQPEIPVDVNHTDQCSAFGREWGL